MLHELFAKVQEISQFHPSEFELGEQLLLVRCIELLDGFHSRPSLCLCASVRDSFLIEQANGVNHPCSPTAYRNVEFQIDSRGENRL